MYLLHSRTVFAKCKPGEGDRRLPDEIWGPGMSPSCLLTPPDTLVRVFDALPPRCFLKIECLCIDWWFTIIFLQQIYLATGHCIETQKLQTNFTKWAAMKNLFMTLPEEISLKALPYL